MLKYINKQNIQLINFDIIFSKIEVILLNDLYQYNLIDNYSINLSNGDVKKLFYHHIIFGICEEILNSDKLYINVIVIPPSIRNFHEIIEFCSSEDINNLLKRLFVSIKSLFPFIIHVSDDYIFENDVNSGETEELVNILYGMYTDRECAGYTFEKIKKFVDKYDLTFLSKDYFNSVKTRLLL